MNVSLGRLEQVELRTAWISESGDFTPWLAQEANLSLLGKAIGLDLEVESMEKGVGPYRADIVCKDTATGQYVLVENQLGETDHKHLGQLLTYAAGLEAVTIVWIAQHFTDEHRAALDWLNRVSDPSINFFALEIELWRIGNSQSAPKFNMVCKPNDWEKVVKATAGQDGPVSGMGQLHLEFWTQFREYMVQQKSAIRVGTPSTDHWKYFAIGRRYFTLAAVNGMRDGYSTVFLKIHGPDAKPHFHLLKARCEAEVAQQFGPGVDWRELPQNLESQFVIRRTSTPTDPNTWPDLNAWFAEKLEAMDKYFRPIIDQVDARNYSPVPDGDAANERAEIDRDQLNEPDMGPPA